ncbi:MAG: fatty acid desaturase, partial [Pseudomonadota bacterium]
LGVVFGFAWACGIDPLTYLLAVVWPSQAILAIRTYIEHRAAPAPEHRSAIVEAEWLFRLLFLNNSLHALHHERPTVPWSKLPELYRAEADAVVQRNGGYLVRGYLSVFARYLFRRREPVEHPFRRRIDT